MRKVKPTKAEMIRAIRAYNYFCAFDPDSKRRCRRNDDGYLRCSICNKELKSAIIEIIRKSGKEKGKP